MSYLEMLWEWEKGDSATREVRIQHSGDWRATLNLTCLEDGRYNGYDQIKRWGETREQACQRCYDEAMARGIIQPA